MNKMQNLSLRCVSSDICFAVWTVMISVFARIHAKWNTNTWPTPVDEKNCIRISNSFNEESINLSFGLQKDKQQYGNYICTCCWFILQFCHNGLITVRTSNAGRFRSDRNSWKKNKQKCIIKNDDIFRACRKFLSQVMTILQACKWMISSI